MPRQNCNSIAVFAVTVCSVFCNTRTNKVFTDITEDLDRYYKGIQYTEVDGVKVLPKSEEIDCYEQRFKPIRDKKKSREYNVKYCQEHKEDNARRQREYRARQKALKQEKPA